MSSLCAEGGPLGGFESAAGFSRLLSDIAAESLELCMVLISAFAISTQPAQAGGSEMEAGAWTHLTRLKPIPYVKKEVLTVLRLKL